MSYRCCLEVLKFCSDAEVLKELCYICALWRQAAGSEELWMTFGEHLGLPRDSMGPSALASYRTAALSHRVGYFAPQGLVVINCLKRTVSLYPQVALRRGMFLVYYGGGVIGIGGFQDGRLVAAVTLYRGTSKVELPLLNVPRYRHAGIAFQDRLYVFGGLCEGASRTFGGLPDTPTQAAEVMELQAAETWQRLPDSAASYRDFTLSATKELIFLCGKCIEMFNPSTSTFAFLSVEFSPGWPLTTLISGTTLIIRKRKSYTCLNLGSFAYQKQSAATKWQALNPENLAVSNAVVIGNTGFYALLNSAYVVNLSTLEEQLVALEWQEGKATLAIL